MNRVYAISGSISISFSPSFAGTFHQK